MRSSSLKDLKGILKDPYMLKDSSETALKSALQISKARNQVRKYSYGTALASPSPPQLSSNKQQLKSVPFGSGTKRLLPQSHEFTQFTYIPDMRRLNTINAA